MISLEKWKILPPLQNLSKKVGDLVKLIAAKGFKELPKVQKNRQIWSHWFLLKFVTYPKHFHRDNQSIQMP